LQFNNVHIACGVDEVFEVVVFRRTIEGIYRLRVFKERVLRRIFGPKGNEVMAVWRKLHNEELHNVYSSPSILRILNQG
jgi:hypothetical protein